MRTRRPWLLPLAPLYGAALAMKRRLFQLGWLKQNRLESPVISVGSVSAGGAGKTPMVLMLARILRHRGYAVRILTRGYKRSSGMTSRVEPFDDAAWQGDEPVLLAQRSGVPVFVGADRYQAGVMAEQREPSEKLVVHLLDDGFQHRQAGARCRYRSADAGGRGGHSASGGESARAAVGDRGGGYRGAARGRGGFAAQRGCRVERRRRKCRRSG